MFNINEKHMQAKKAILNLTHVNSLLCCIQNIHILTINVEYKFKIRILSIKTKIFFPVPKLEKGFEKKI